MELSSDQQDLDNCHLRKLRWTEKRKTVVDLKSKDLRFFLYVNKMTKQDASGYVYLYSNDVISLFEVV